MPDFMFGRAAERQAFEELKKCENIESSLCVIKNFIIGSVPAKNHFAKLGLIPLYV